MGQEGCCVKGPRVPARTEGGSGAVRAALPRGPTPAEPQPHLRWPHGGAKAPPAGRGVRWPWTAQSDDARPAPPRPAHRGVTWRSWRSLITRRQHLGAAPAPPPRRVLLSKMAAPGALPPQPPPPPPL